MSAATIKARGQNICTGLCVPEAFELATLIYRSVWQRVGHPGRGKKPEFKLERYPTLDELACCASCILGICYTFNPASSELGGHESRLLSSKVCREWMAEMRERSLPIQGSTLPTQAICLH